MHLTRTELDANLHRFYRLEIVRGLFGDWGLMRNWGRIGSAGRLAATKRKTSLTLDSEAIESARELGINVSAVAEAAVIEAVAAARRKQWLTENAGAFAAQSDWHDRHGHPLADIMTAPGGPLSQSPPPRMTVSAVSRGIR